MAHKYYEGAALEVVDKIESAPDTYTLTFALPNGAVSDIHQAFDFSAVQHMAQPQMLGHYFPTGAGLGIPPAENSSLIDRLFGHLKSANTEEKLWLAPHAGYAGPDLSSPSEALCQLILQRAQADKTLQHKSNLLQQIINVPDQLDQLQASYDVADLLGHFPALVTAEELWDIQPSGPMSRTYTIIPAPEASMQLKRPCFSVSVKHQKAIAPQNMLGEKITVNQRHEGVTSSHICRLQIGDIVNVNQRIKPQKAYQADFEMGRDIVFIAQGNAYERSLSYLFEKQAHPQGQNSQFILLSGFKNKSDIPRNDSFKSLLQDGTLSAVFYAVSREQGTDKSHGNAYYVHGQRVTDILGGMDIQKMTAPIFYVAGSNGFCDGVKAQIHSQSLQAPDIRVSNSPARIRRPSYPA